MKKFLTITLPVFAVTILAIGLLVEVAIRLTWDPSRGRPGLFVSDPVRIERLSARYDGWFAGVPVRTNALGFRDAREYRLEKTPATVRILVLGDSVTFGHGCVYEQTYPYLLEQRLKAWRPDIDWQVWNLGVPGYNTSQELAYLLEVGPTYRPDLVIVGFFWNDIVDNRPVERPTRKAIVASEVKTWLKRHAYSFDWYKKMYLTLKYRLSGSREEHDLLENLAAQDKLLARPSESANIEEPLTNPASMTDAEFAEAQCPAPAKAVAAGELQKAPGIDSWKAAVQQLQRLHRGGTYRISFFVNAAPNICRTTSEDLDLFDPRSSTPVDVYFLSVVSDGTPAISSHDAFLRYRPSQVPQAGGHSIGYANVVKANVLFEFLRDRVLPETLLKRQAHAS